MIMTAEQLVEKVKEIANSATIYKLGTFGNKTINGKRQWDCSGLLKGILWGYPENGKYASNGVLDQNADTIISNCLDISNDFSNIMPGEVVWIKGHMGIYIGDGKVVEATPNWDNGVQISTCANIVNGAKKRKWLKHGKSPYIEYLQENIVNNWIACLQLECNKQGFSNQKVDGIAGKVTLASCPQLSNKSKGKITALVQERLNNLGYNCGSIDGINGDNTQKAIKKFQQDNGLQVDGIVGKNTWKCLLMI
ncbi:hypothetical protein CWE04_01715 [Thomasclavelia cocleata]|uniref:Putative peptidoglycan binding domain-containing protein n=1 Tax=Thomasclavelia cocleata TaxID=69824 RepID=A0A1I0CZU6_9FIRM|nr:peptidoglycan-binding protein [Thomasclavelia cocleata]MCR1959737.1 peptidoglycan-binding protein [Thomasclavelia cocleata]NDO41075.1 hypothetical protein [Thomasclavelia cocleata]PJN81602.1 hypothetical protein CWE04_01715 [Thomasclavelia cocleata]SET25416.1 Putative peptidoglycan binding domain-containing protein [Thomasclavelia cocleata]